MYSSYSFTTSTLDRDQWSASGPGHALSPEKGPPVPIGLEAGWAPQPVWTQRLEEVVIYTMKKLPDIIKEDLLMSSAFGSSY
jgi:hypothetical protein